MQLIKNNIYTCGVDDHDKKLFDQLIPLPNGTTYNSFLIKGTEKTALIDTTYSNTLQEYLDCMQDGGGMPKIDYIIANHGEGDHTGGLTKMLEIYPSAKIVTNAKCKEILIDSYMIDEDKFLTVADKETLSLGGKTLQFYITPFVHWPDTMFACLVEDKMLFTCDFLGSHTTHNSEGIFYASETPEYLAGAKRYYAEIMMPFATQARKYVDLIENEIKPEMILPSHGGIYKNPGFILNAYKAWTDPTPKNKVAIAYVSMYKNTENMAKYLAEKLKAKGVEAVLFNSVEDDLGELAIELVDCATIVFGASMMLAKAHPVAISTVYTVNLIRPKARYYSIIGSYGWGGNLEGTIEENLKSLKAEKLDYVITKGCPKPETFTQLDKLAEEIAQKHKEFL